MNTWPLRHSARTLAFPKLQNLTALPLVRCRPRFFTTTRLRLNDDARLRELGREIEDDYATIRDNYATPKHPIVLAHGLLGFSELQLINAFPAVQYWRGIKEALVANGITVFTPTVPPSSSIEDRAAKLSEAIAHAASLPTPPGVDTPAVNIVAHSMGGLDARYMIAHLVPPGIRIASLVTIATPHRGSAFADFVLGDESASGPLHLPNLYGMLERAGLGTAAFGQLTRKYMADEFNPATPDDPNVRYFSFGACCQPPPLLSPFRQSHRVVGDAEGSNDGLVSVDSSRWGEYKGTLLGVSHLDLINWSNMMRWTVRQWMGMKRPFNAIAFYLDIADMLAKEGL